MDDFLDRLKARGLSVQTVGTYAAAVRAFVKWWEETSGEAFDPASVTSLDVADYRRHLLSRGRKPATVNLRLDALSSFFAWAASAGLVPVDPTEGVRRVPEQKSSPRWLTRRELGALVRAAQKHGAPRDRALLALLLHAGLRVSEAVNLKVRDVVIRERSGHVAVRRGKGEKYREVPLNATARKMIQEWLGDHPGGEHLFPGRNGGPVTPRAIQKRLKELGRLAGVEVTPHRLRHTFCKMLVDAGESLDRVAVLAGHANLNTTARYTRPGMDDLERAVEKLAWDWVHASVMNVQGGNGCIQSVHPCFTKNRQNAPDFNRGMNGEKQKRLLSRAFSFFAVAFRGEEVKSGGSDDDP